MIILPAIPTVAAAERILGFLNAQAAAARLELGDLNARLSHARVEARDSDVAQLRSVNEKLVQAAVEAAFAADAAAHELARLASASQRDDLTGTLNRQLMRARLDSAIKMAARTKTRLAALFVDLDQFKTINDTLGHAHGDEAMRIVARRLQDTVRQTDAVSRYGGDEFLVLLSPIAQPTDAARIAVKINAALAEPVVLGGQVVRMSASVGIALYPEDGLDADTLVDRSDSAMYRSKRQRPGTFSFFDKHASESLAPSAGGSVSTAAPPAAVPAELPPPELLEANERLVVAAMEAQEASMRTEEMRLQQVRFMAMVAHELRDPLAPIRTAAELLVRPGSDDRVLGKAREIISRQVEHLSRLVEDLIDSSRVSAGKFTLRMAPVELVGVIKLAIDACRLDIQVHSQTLNAMLPDSPLPVHGDSMRLLQVFINLIENAVKYTQAGGEITLSASMADGAIVVTIADNGIGIARETLPHIFDLFVQEPGDRARRNGGLGIGLAVVRELVEGHGGTVVAHSDGPHLGSEFVVTLPAASARDLAAESAGA